ncbi:MAG: hypothetical protein CK538_07590 [Opitutia bacterium]|nr:MAG: hypothetical protein CK538_07590 [Opitutae bacterium]
MTFKTDSPLRASATSLSGTFQHRIAFELEGIAHFATDNFLELYPNEPKTVTVKLAQPQTLKKPQQAFSYRPPASAHLNPDPDERTP